MYFAKTAIRNDQLVTMSEYISTRLVRKGAISSYYVVKCIRNAQRPQLVNSICFIKQTIVKDRTNVTKAQNQLEKYQSIYKNEVGVHDYIKREIANSEKYYSTLLDHWHEVEGEQHKFYIVTKYEQYSDLHHFIEFINQQKIQLSDAEVKFIIKKILKAVLKLHNVGIMHRDIKPENIFIDQSFQIKLGDFGISLLQEIDKNPKSSHIIGTVGFMAPQMFNGQGPYSYSVDVWAIGVIAYILIYMAYPYGSKKQDYHLNIKAELNENRHSSKYSDHFSGGLKYFMKRFFVKPAQKRDKAKKLYNQKQIRDFNLSEEIVQGFRKKYKKHIDELNSCNLSMIQSFPLQQQRLYKERILQVVHYKQWGYFFFLTNLKVIALFNSKANERVIRIYPDCLDKKDKYCLIVNEVFKLHFRQLKKDIEEKGKVYTKRLNCTIDDIVKCNNTLVVRLKLQLFNHQQLNYKKMQRQTQLPPQYEDKQWLPIQNHTQQFFFFPKQQSQSKLQNIEYTTYSSSVTLHSHTLKPLLIIITDIKHKEYDCDDRYNIKKYDEAEGIPYLGENPQHRKMYEHTKKILTFAATRQKQRNANSFLNQYDVNG